MDTTYRLLAIDEGRQQIMLVDTSLTAPVWTLSLEDYPLARDMQRLDADRVLVDDEAVKRARLALLAATRQVLRNGLALIGVSAPARM